ncbi:hypothetical protein QOZ80_5AG0404350 [Eleusine coracana subsp. coracana]|nr:hypothetical protein QOZ80_5AG0404350 [Eleusine coracana subsp. coracana]
MLRYIVATVVSVLTVAVVVMVIIVDFRGPDNLRLSVLQGHIEATTLWSKVERTIYPSTTLLPQAGLTSRRLPCDDEEILGNVDLGLGGAETALEPGGEDSCSQDGFRGPYKIETYEAAPSSSLRITLSVYNPSGRVGIKCHNIFIRVLDLPNGANSFQGMVQIGSFVLDKGFPVGRQSSHTLRRWMDVSDPSVRAYIARTYPGSTSFPAMVQVNATITSLTKVGRKGSSKPVSHWCWPVTVGLDEPSVASDAVTCMPREKVVYPVGSMLLSPAPAPADTVS